MRACLDKLAKCDGEQARAEQHKAGCGYREEAIGHEVTIAHGNTFRFRNAAPLLEQNDMPRRTVKRISRGFENRNLTDAFEQQ